MRRSEQREEVTVCSLDAVQNMPGNALTLAKCLSPVVIFDRRDQRERCVRENGSKQRLLGLRWVSVIARHVLGLKAGGSKMEERKRRY